MLRILLPIRPQAFRTSINLFSAWFARSERTSAIGDKNVPINPGEMDNCETAAETAAGECSLVPSRINTDHVVTSPTVGRMDLVEVDLCQENTCLVYGSIDDAQSKQKSNVSMEDTIHITTEFNKYPLTSLPIFQPPRLGV